MKNHVHISDRNYEHIVEANRREFWLSHCVFCGRGLTRRTKPKKELKKAGIAA